MIKLTSHGSHMAVLQPLMVAAVLVSSWLLGCKRSSPAETVSITEQVANEEREFARAVLLKVNDENDMPSFDLSDLLNRGEIRAIPPTSDFNATESLSSSLNAAQQYSVGSQQGEQGTLTRVETFAFKEGFSPGQMKFRDQTLPFQISLSANAELKVVRSFRSSAESLGVPPFSLIQLPLTETNVLRMRVGDLFVIPLETQFIAAVDGSFMRSAAKAGAPLLRLLGSSMQAHGGSGLRANLMVTGRFEMHLFKTAKNIVRVRFFEQSSQSLSGGGTASASGSLKYTILPLSKLHTIAELKKLRRVRFYGSPKLQLSDPLKGTFKKNVLIETQGKDVNAAELAIQNDGLLELANNVTLTAEKIQQLTTDRLNEIVGTINESVLKKVNEPISQVKKYTDHEFALTASASWEVKKGQRLQFFSEYEFDVSQPLGLEAFLHAVSGASFYLSASSKLPKLTARIRGSHNLVVAEKVASDSIGMKDPPVRRLLSASARSTVRDKSFKINLSNVARFSISESWNRERYRATLKDGDEPEHQSDLVRWSYTQGYKFGMISDQQNRTSGYLTTAIAEPDLRSMFWLTRHLSLRGWSNGNLNLFFNAAYNMTGPVGESLGLANLYKGEVASALSGRITVALTHRAMQKIFDPERTTQERIWSAVARVAVSFDNTFGLPFVMFPMGYPEGVSGTAVQQNCDTITKLWGSFYCHFVAREFIPALQAAQREANEQSRIQFFESFLSRGFGANKIGSDLLLRVLLELLIVSGEQLSPEELGVQLEVLQESTSDPQYNPSLIYGNSKALEYLGAFSPPR